MNVIQKNWSALIKPKGLVTEPGGDPVLLIHGFASSARTNWQPSAVKYWSVTSGVARWPASWASHKFWFIRRPAC